jgi:hypothetical protein
MDNAAEGAAAIMGAGLSGSIALIAGRTVVTDNSCMQWIKGYDTGTPACANRRQDLHDHRKQDDRQETMQPLAH